MIGLTPAELSYGLGISKSTAYTLLEKRNNQSEETAQNQNKRIIIPSNVIRKLLCERDFHYPNLNISFQVVKGGAGKTSLATNFAYRCAQYGAKVLLIDFDQQGNASRCFNIETRSKPVFLNIFRQECDIKDAIISVNEFFDIIPSNLNNSRLDYEMSQKVSLNIRDMLRKLLEPIRSNYDLVIMDCPPAINRINASVTCGSDLIVIPVNPDQYALDGMQFSVSEIEMIKKDFNLKDLEYKLVWNKYDAREKLGAIYMHALVKDAAMLHKLIPIVVRTDTEFKNSVHEKRSIFENGKKSAAREDVDELTRELLGLRDWSPKKGKG
ncbi:ParA family protein [Candidatus Odyssella thessalonicensis]|uniref:ParA family protein n=1 Tax=Candidatus Odyssella thessalonicensis TaxID=84647 RepID=UPI000225ACD4|nr:AAA family ATPase [Candidatus Odyssella thessalonicensis]